MLDADKGRKMETQNGFNTNRKDVNEGKWNRAPSNVSMEARNRLIYQSNFKLEWTDRYNWYELILFVPEPFLKVERSFYFICSMHAQFKIEIN